MQMFLQFQSEDLLDVFRFSTPFLELLSCFRVMRTFILTSETVSVE